MPKTHSHICAYCDSHFANRKKASKYCSANCSAQAKKRRLQKTCVQCGIVVECTPSQIKNSVRTFCGHECRFEWQRAGSTRRQRIAVACAHCNAELSVLPSRAKNFKKHFCNRDCFGAWTRENMPKGVDNPTYKSRVEVSCAQCKKAFMSTRHRAQMRNNLFCGNACRIEYQSKNPRVGENAVNFRERIPCDYCGGINNRPHTMTHEHNKHFCGKICCRRWKADNLRGDNWIVYQGKKTIFVACAECGKQTEKRARDVAIAGRQSYCSRACQRAGHGKAIGGANHSRWRGGISSFRGPNWVKQTRSARKRDSHTCQHCGKKHKKGERQFPVHHIRPFREFGYVPGKNEHYKQANQLLNLITLCVRCHFKAEFGEIAIQPKLL